MGCDYRKDKKKTEDLGAHGECRVAGFVSEDILLNGIFPQLPAKALPALQKHRNMFKRVLPADRGTLIAFPRFS